MSVLAAPPGTQPFAVEFGRPATVGLMQEGAAGLQLKIPLLGGAPREKIFPWAGALLDQPGLQLLQSGEALLGWAAVPVKNDRTLLAQTQTLYRRVLAATKGRHLYRLWNYVPRINTLIDGFENYRAFCQGRSLAFEEALGNSFSRVLSAASAVGVEDDFLSLIFVAGSASPRHMENPEQVPAYQYPAEHGPRSPSFSRATVARIGERTFTFISGTSAIKGHATIAPDTLRGQIDCTLDNLRLISREAGAGDHLGAAYCRERHFKIYLRHTADLAVARARLERELLRPADVATYLRADICRAALQIEIEATLVS